MTTMKEKKECHPERQRRTRAALCARILSTPRIDTSDLDAAEVSAALINADRSRCGRSPDMTIEEALLLLERMEQKIREYLERADFELERTSFNPALYDEVNGEGAAQRVVDRLREQKRVYD